MGTNNCYVLYFMQLCGIIFHPTVFSLVEKYIIGPSGSTIIYFFSHFEINHIFFLYILWVGSVKLVRHNFTSMKSVFMVADTLPCSELDIFSWALCASRGFFLYIQCTKLWLMLKFHGCPRELWCLKYLLKQISSYGFYLNVIGAYVWVVHLVLNRRL